MPSVKVIILEYVCPGLGAIMANIMFLSPLSDLQRAVRKGDIGDLNPTPWAFMLGNCLGWTCYGILLRNLFIFFGNCPGFLISIWLNLGAVKLMYQKHHSREMRDSVANLLFVQQQELGHAGRDKNIQGEARLLHSLHDGEGDGDNVAKESTEEQEGDDSTNLKTAAEWMKIVIDVTSQNNPAPISHEKLVMANALLWTTYIAILCLLPTTIITQRDKEIAVASLVNLNLVFFYGAPLSTIMTVLKTRNSASIHIPNMITCTLNGTFWTAYGIAIMDPFISVPNGLGTLFGVIQVFLCLIFPRNTIHLSKQNREDTLEPTVKDAFPLVIDE